MANLSYEIREHASRLRVKGVGVWGYKMTSDDQALSFSCAIAGALGEMERGIKRLKEISEQDAQNQKEALIGRLVLEHATKNPKLASLIGRLISDSKINS